MYNDKNSNNEIMMIIIVIIEHATYADILGDSPHHIIEHTM